MENNSSCARTVDREKNKSISADTRATQGFLSATKGYIDVIMLELEQNKMAALKSAENSAEEREKKLKIE